MSDQVSPIQPALDQASWLTASLPIRLYGDPALTTPCADVSPGELRDGSAKRWAAAMEKFLRSYRAHTGTGRGLAANQIGISKRIVLIWVEDEPEIFINPTVLVTEGEGIYPEACLSSASLIAGEVRRPWLASIKYERLDGSIRENQFDPLASRVLLHEIDH
ncbi:MAG: def, partial [Candidatus Saccharibacteria bacterium]|nr:def [Candidatus Saccharibacteria bacterium]